MEQDHEMVLRLSRLVDRWAEENLGDEPDWKPLEKAIPRRWCGGFMWMNRIEWAGEVIEIYKHGITRNSLHLDHHGRAYRYTPKSNGYVEITLDTALRHVFDGLEEMGWSRETMYDEEFIRAKHKALRELGYTVISTAPLEEDKRDAE